MVTSFFDGLLSSHQTLLLTVIPLWLVADTNAPRVLLAWLFATNTIGAVLFQVPVSRTVTGLKTAMRAEARAAAFMVASCLIILVTDHTVIWLTIPLIWLAHVTVTGAELFESSASWSLQSDLSDQSRLGDYQGVASVANTLGIIWTPALYTFLATTLHATGWLIIAAIVVAAAAGIRPSARVAQHYLEEGPSAAQTGPGRSRIAALPLAALGRSVASCCHGPRRDERTVPGGDTARLSACPRTRPALRACASPGRRRRGGRARRGGSRPGPGQLPACRCHGRHRSIAMPAHPAADGQLRHGGLGHRHMQAQGAAMALAESRGEQVGAEHLLIALLDQGTASVLEALGRAGLDPATVRRAAATAIGAPGLPPIVLPRAHARGDHGPRAAARRGTGRPGLGRAPLAAGPPARRQAAPPFRPRGAAASGAERSVARRRPARPRR